MSVPLGPFGPWLRRRRARRAGSPFRSRGLDAFEGLFGEGAVEGEIDRLESLRRRRDLRVLEIGCGEGRLLLELLTRRPDLETHGLNKDRWGAMRGDASFLAAARRHGVRLPREARPPRAWFLDLDREPLPFADESVDLVLSQVAFHYVREKARLLEEVWRVLAPEGAALLHVDTRHPAAPDFLAGTTPRFVVLDGGQGPRGLDGVADELRSVDVDVTCRETPPEPKKGRVRVLLRMRRSAPGRLDLGLEIDEPATFNLWPLRRPEVDPSLFWGWRSVYRRRRAPAARS